MASALSPRELDRRASDGLEVTLLWHPDTNRLTIEVYDELAAQMFEFEVSPQCADDAFRHPYAYAPTAVVLKAADRAAVRVSQNGADRCVKRILAPATGANA
jgi:hypothetical protein